PKEKDDPFGPFVSDDYEAKDNKHFAVDMECPSDFSGLDMNNPTIHPELVTDFDQEHYLERNLLGEGFEGVVARQTIYHYQSPMDSLATDNKLVPLDKFTEHTRNKACEVLDSASPADSAPSKDEILEHANRMHELEMELSRMRDGMIK
ncbi:MAG: hypothetical protein NTX25_00775, partial [Proteobacteria bacterium]|nr:hypothetical protein [Pseudomonadota bacterium]